MPPKAEQKSETKKTRTIQREARKHSRRHTTDTHALLKECPSVFCFCYTISHTRLPFFSPPLSSSITPVTVSSRPDSFYFRVTTVCGVAQICTPFLLLQHTFFCLLCLRISEPWKEEETEKKRTHTMAKHTMVALLPCHPVFHFGSLSFRP